MDVYLDGLLWFDGHGRRRTASPRLLVSVALFFGIDFYLSVVFTVVIHSWLSQYQMREFLVSFFVNSCCENPKFVGLSFLIALAFMPPFLHSYTGAYGNVPFSQSGELWTPVDKHVWKFFILAPIFPASLVAMAICPACVQWQHVESGPLYKSPARKLRAVLN